MAAGMEVAGDGLDAELDVPVGRHRLLREDRLEVVSPQRPRLNQGVVHLQGSYSVVSGHFTAVFFFNSSSHLVETLCNFDFPSRRCCLYCLAKLAPRHLL